MDERKEIVMMIIERIGLGMMLMWGGGINNSSDSVFFFHRRGE